MPDNDSWIYSHIDEFIKLDKIDQLKLLLKEEHEYEVMKTERDIPVLPIVHIPDEIHLQFCGWCIILNSDGTWDWEDTTGG